MSATLTPSVDEQTMIDAFGMQVEDEFAQIIERLDTVLPCGRIECDAAADYVIICRGRCRYRGFVCAPCLAKVRAELADRWMECKYCHFEPDAPGLDSMVTAVLL